MTAISLEIPKPVNWRAEVKTAVREALRTPWVLAVALICATFLGTCLLAALVWLAWTQRDAGTILSMVNTFVTVFVLKQVSTVNTRVGNLEVQTDGHMTALRDAALQKGQAAA